MREKRERRRSKKATKSGNKGKPNEVVVDFSTVPVPGVIPPLSTLTCTKKRPWMT